MRREIRSRKLNLSAFAHFLITVDCFFLRENQSTVFCLVRHSKTIGVPWIYFNKYSKYRYLHEENEFMNLLEIKNKKPLVFNYANYVTPQFVANVVNVVGGSPLMAREIEEFPDLVAASDAVVINSGTWRRAELLETIKLAQLANHAGKVVVLDPVAVGIPSRSIPVTALMADAQVNIIRGNAAEIAWFAGIEFLSQGIDATGNGDVKKIAALAAKKTGAIIALSGKIDVVSDGDTTKVIPVDVPLLATNVGTGDGLSALIGTYNSDVISIDNTVRAMATMKLAGKKASEKVTTPGFFVNQLLDELYLLQQAELEDFIKREVNHE